MIETTRMTNYEFVMTNRSFVLVKVCLDASNYEPGNCELPTKESWPLAGRGRGGKSLSVCEFIQ